MTGKDDGCLPCHPCLSPLNPAVLLGVTPVTPVSCPERRIVPEITNSRDLEAREYMEAVNRLQLMAAKSTSQDAGR